MLRSALVGLIRFYQVAISPRLPASCRFQPTCSAYALEAVERHGVLKGSRLAAWRLLRCHPWGGMGFDPVPGGTPPGTGSLHPQQGRDPAPRGVGDETRTAEVTQNP